MHKHFIILFFILLSFPSIAQISEDNSAEMELSKYRGSNTRSWDLIHTKLEVSFDWSAKYLFGEATLTLKPYFYEQDVISLDAKGMDINNISIGKKEVPFDYDGMKLLIPLDKSLSKTDTVILSISYVAKPYEREAKGSDAIQENRGLYFVNADGKDGNKPMQIWTQGETQANSGWFPTIDSPNERCTQEILITVKDNFKTLSNGLMTNQKQNQNGTRTDTWTMDQPHAPYLFMMAIGEFETVKEEWEGIPLTYHVEKGYGKYAKDIFGHTPEMITFFSELFDYPYPWKKYDQVVVRDFVSGAMENTTASLFMEDLNMTDRELLDYDWDDIIAHELMHQWFGDLVTCESWSNLTLNEGFASYAEYLWNEHKYGEDEGNYNFLIEQEGYMDDAIEEPKNLIRYHYQDREDMFDSHSYNKGAAVLHMLRNYLGDEAFFAGLNIYLTDNAYQSVELADLRLAFEKVSGEDLNWFFDQWYFFAGHPVLEVAHTYENDTLTISIEQTQLADEVPIYKLPVFIDVWKGDELFSYPVLINDAFETYQFPMETAPDLVIFDSERQLLAEINHPKSEEEYYAQFMKDQSLYSRIETMDSLFHFKSKKLIDEILEKAFQDPFYVVRQYAIDYLMENEIKVKKYETQVLNALRDSSAHVRSYAISYLGQSDFDKYKNEILAAVSDQSYMVVGTSISQVAENGEVLTEKVINSLSEESNLNIVISLAAYFNTINDPYVYDWYEQKLATLDGTTLFYFIQMYAEKLIDAPSEIKINAIPSLEKIAKHNSNYMARFSAFQALVLMSDLEDVSRIIEEVRASEVDNRLVDLYRNF